MRHVGEKRSKRFPASSRLGRGWMRILGLLILVLGVVCVLMAFELPVWVPPERTEQISDLAMTIGQTLISIAATALLFERYGYADYTTKRVCDALARDEVLNVLSPKRKEELKDLLFEDIYLGHQPSADPLSLVDQLDQDIDRLLENYYYEEYYTSCDISIVETMDHQKLFYKQIHRNFTAHPIRTNCECMLERLYRVRISGLGEDTRDLNGNPLSAVQIKKLVIRGKDLKEGKDYQLKVEPLPDDSSPYMNIYTIELNSEWKTFSDELRVEMVYETYVPYSDPYYSVTVDRPCKYFSCNFSFSTDTHDLHVKGYGFMSTGDTLRKHQIKMQNGVTVRYRSWILPGDGAVAFFYPKENMSS